MGCFKISHTVPIYRSAKLCNNAKMSIIAVLGATGPTGLEVLKQGLARGLEVRAVVRNPAKITFEDPKLKIIKSNIFDKDSLVTAFNGCDAVFSCLGAPISWSRVTLYSDSIKSISEAARETNVNKLIVVGAAMSTDEPGHPWWWRWIARFIIGPGLDDNVRMENYLTENCQDINYTVARAPHLTYGPITDKPILTEDSQLVKKGSYDLSRADLARFMLDCLDTKTHDKMLIAIATP